jgi:hypothetical protein
MRTLRRWWADARNSAWMIVVGLLISLALYAFAYNAPQMIYLNTSALVTVMFLPVVVCVCLVIHDGHSSASFGWSKPASNLLYGIAASILCVAFLVFGNLAGNGDPRMGNGPSAQFQWLMLLFGLFSIAFSFALSNKRWKLYEEMHVEQPKPGPGLKLV